MLFFGDYSWFVLFYFGDYSWYPTVEIIKLDQCHLGHYVESSKNPFPSCFKSFMWMLFRDDKNFRVISIKFFFPCIISTPNLWMHGSTTYYRSSIVVARMTMSWSSYYGVCRFLFIFFNWGFWALDYSINSICLVRV